MLIDPRLLKYILIYAFLEIIFISVKFDRRSKSIFLLFEEFLIFLLSN